MLSDENAESHDDNQEKTPGQPAQEPSPQETDPQPQTSAHRASGVEWNKFSRYSILLLIVASGVAFFRIINLFLIPILLATIFAVLLYPVYNWLLHRLRRNRILSSLLCCSILVLLVIIPAYIIIQLLVRQMAGLYVSIEPLIREFAANWQDNEVVRRLLDSRIFQLLLHEVDWAALGQTMARNAAGIVTMVINKTYAGIFGLLFDLLIMLFVLFYFFIDGKNILQHIKSLLPLRPEYQDMIIVHFGLISRATIKGTLIIGLIDGFLGGITLLVFGINEWIFWGFIIAVLSILPLVGPTFILVPASIIQILMGNLWQGIGILVVTYAIVANADNFVRPRIVGKSAKMHDLLVFFSTLGGLSIYGITGFIIGPVIASLFLTALEIYKKEFKPQSAS